METVSDNPVLSKVFRLFQDYQKQRQFSRLLLETRGGALTAHLSVQCAPAPSMESTRPTEARKLRRITPSRRKRNQARREQWLANRKADTVNQDNCVLEKNEDTEVVNKTVKASTDSTTKDLKVLSEGQSTKIVQTVKVSEKDSQKIGVIEQIDGQIESTVTTLNFDLTISAVQLLDAYCSIEDNLCYGDVDAKVLFISENPSSQVKETNSENTLFTLEIQVENDETFLAKLQKRFDSWDPLYFGKPRGKLVKSMKRI